MKTRKSFTLSNSHITEIIDSIQQTATQHGFNRKDILRITLMLEEILMKYQSKLGEDGSLVLVENTAKMKYRFRILLFANPYNPFQANEDEAVLQSLLSGQSLAIQWGYRDGTNSLSYTFKKQLKNSFLIQLVISILLAIACFAICAILPKSVGAFVFEQVITPLYNTLIGLISFIAGPLVLLSVMWGVFSIGDVTSLSSIGKKMILRFLLMMFVSTILILAIQLPLYKISDGAGGGFAFSELYGIVLDIIPSNILAPFLDGNTLQIIFIAIIIGIAMLLLSEKTTVASKFVEQTNYIVQLIMEGIGKLIPILVFTSIAQLLYSGGIAMLATSYKLIIAIVLASAIILLFYILMTCLRFKISPRLLAKKMLSTFIIAITTASSSAAFADNMETCEKKLGIDKKIVNVGVPLGQTIFMPGTTILFASLAMYLASSYNVTISLPWIITLGLITTILAIAAPPVPGGALACYALIVAQMGLPAESVATFCALGVIPEFLIVAVNLSSLQMELMHISHGLGMLNIDKAKANSNS